MKIGWKELLLQKYLSRKARPSRLHRFLKEKTAGVVPLFSPPFPGNSFKNGTGGPFLTKIQAAAVQVELEPCRDPLDYAAKMQRCVDKAASRGASLVVFPENNGLMLLGMLPVTGDLQREKYPAGSKVPPEELPVEDIIRYSNPFVTRTAHLTFSYLAATYGLYIMAGSFMELDEAARIVNRAYLYDPGGRLMGIQDKVHLFPTELKWGLSPGHNFRVFPSPLGTLSMPVCMDATYFETFRILQLLGAEIIMVPIADTGPYNFSLALRGTWSRVQEVPAYGVRSALVGSFAGFSFSGRAGLFAPLELSPSGDGILAETPEPAGEDMAVAELDLEALREMRSAHPPYLGDTNLDLYRRYQPFLYRSL